MNERVKHWLAFVRDVSQRLLTSIDPLAAPEHVWVLYAAQLARKGLRKTTIEQHMSSIRSWHVDNGVAVPPQAGLLKRVVRGVQANPLHAPQKPLAPPRMPLTTQVLLRMREFIDLSSWSGALLWLT